MAALTNGVAVGDVTLSGNAVWTSGTNAETGTIKAYGKTSLDSRLDLTLSGGSRSELRNDRAGSLRGAWIDANGKSRVSASHNCWTDAVWFFPELTSLSEVNSTRFHGSRGALVLGYVGLETRNGRSVQHIQSFRYVTSKTIKETSFSQKMSTVDYYLDAQTLVPLSIAFSAHPDNDATTNIAVDVDYADYQVSNGILVPFRITKRWQGNPLLDITVTNVTVNSGLPDSLFTTR